MGSFVRLSGGIAAVALAGAAFAAPSAAQAQAMSDPPTYRVPCSTTALVTAINAANSFSSANIRLHPRCKYMITTPATGTDGLPIITGHINLVGGFGTVIKRNSATAFRILEVAAAATLHVTSVSLLDGSTAGLGGGISNAGTLTLNAVILSGNTAGNGGGLSNAAGATATVTASHFTANTTTSVGGGGVLNSGNLRVIGSTFSGNTAPINGGGLNNQAAGTARLFWTSFTGNVSGGLGGGISNLGTTSIVGGSIRFNKGSGGGGIATSNTHVTLHQTIVRNNTPNNCSPVNTIPGCHN
jgi:hypothetical protein